jgi:hypothetical protein
MVCSRRNVGDFVVTTDSDDDQPIFPDRVKELVVDGRNQLRVADLTYVAIGTAYRRKPSRCPVGILTALFTSASQREASASWRDRHDGVGGLVQHPAPACLDRRHAAAEAEANHHAALEATPMAA